MTAATITARVRTQDPTREVVVLTVTDAETFTSEKFGNVEAANATWNEDLGATAIPGPFLAISTNVVTIHAGGVTDKKLCLELFGHLGA